MNRLPLIERSRGDTIAWCDGRAVTAEVFAAQVRALAARLPAQGYAINLCNDRYAFMLAFAAAISAGQTNLLPADRLPATVADLRARYPDSYVLADGASDAHCSDDGDVRVDPRVATPDPANEAGMPAIESEHLAAIVFTSGSTGQPQAIIKPWRTLYYGTCLNAAEMGVDGPVTHSLVATVPPHHMYGLETSILLALLAPVAVSARRPFAPHDIADALAAVPAPRLLISTPVHLQVLCDPATALPEIDQVYSATAPLDPELARAIESVHGTRMVEIYGCSEVGSLALRESVRDPVWALARDFTLTVEDGVAQLVGAHLPGPVLLQDRIELVSERRFHLIGRNSDLINVAGRRASLADLSQRLLRVNGIEDGVIFEPPRLPGDHVNRPAALVVAPGMDAEAVRRGLREWVDAAFLPRPIRFVAALPRSETGKLTRTALLAAFRAAGPRGDVAASAGAVGAAEP